MYSVVETAILRGIDGFVVSVEADVSEGGLPVFEMVGFLSSEVKEAKERVKLGVLEYLNKEYGIIEKDFISAELEVVPAGKARDIGFDRSLIAGYGHDDRVCAYAELAGLFDAKNPKRHMHFRG